MNLGMRYFAAGLLLSVFTTATSAFAFVKTADLPPVEQECAILLGQRPLFKVHEIEPGVIHISFENPRDLTDTFMRFQEHYESPRFRGLVFSRNEFKKWYRQEKEGHFTYHADWGGFNIPGYVLQPFLEGRFRKLSSKEKALLDQFRDRTGRYYIIGTDAGDESSIRHERAHARFYLNDAYRLEMENAVASEDTTDIKTWLTKAGYAENVFADETHAYLLDPKTAPEDFPKDRYLDLTASLQAIEQKFYPSAQTPP